MMTENKKSQLMQDASSLITRLFMKYEITRNKPIDIGDGSRLYASQLHMLEAIGKGYGNTVTALTGYFKITKGAVSQNVTKLCTAGYILKTKRKGNDKEVILELTKKGWTAFELHENYGASAKTEMIRLGNIYTGKEILTFMENPEQTSTLFRSMPAPHSAGSQHPIPEQASR
jgi:DNA-binding MarR family transcriptional regulator